MVDDNGIFSACSICRGLVRIYILYYLFHREVRCGMTASTVFSTIIGVQIIYTQYQRSRLQDTIFPFLIIISAQTAYATQLCRFCLK